MGLKRKKTAIEKEWTALKKFETRFLKRYSEAGQSLLYQKLEKVVPERLQSTLNLAFCKAFQLVFEKGTPLIEKTYRKEQQEYKYKLNAYAAELKDSHKNLKAFSKQAGASTTKNLLASGVEGIGTGILGIGIPDIPIFTGMILKSIYEISLGFGYSYDTEDEQIFILKLIKTSLSHGEGLTAGNADIDSWLAHRTGTLGRKQVLLREASDVLSEEMLYMKFIQGIPVAGVIGGISDSIYLKRITDYAAMKYKRRFLTDREAAVNTL